jgi:hypothetical protein
MFMDLDAVGNTVKNYLGKVADVLKKISGVLGVLGSKLYDKAGFLAGRALDRIPEGKRRPALLCTAGTVFLLILAIVVTLAARAGKAPGENLLPETAAGPRVPAEDFFIPEEPDFLPGVLPERDPRQGWSTDDVRPFWKNPEDSARREDWHREMGVVIDRLMDSVP